MNTKKLGADRGKRSGLLAALRSNAAGNTLTLAAAAMLPIAAAVGAGVDTSRVYFARTRLQQACDAGVLAGRRFFAGGAEGSALPAKVTDEVRKYFQFNWPQGTLGSTNVAVNPTAGSSDQLQLTVNTAVPTTIMAIFGNRTMPVSVSCSARDDYTNIDLALVLDVTGSMNCLPGEEAPTCANGNNNNSDQAGSKISGLRSAVLDLYDTLKPTEDQFNSAASNRKRIRWGVVPYSSTVNVGKQLYATDTDWIETNNNYRSPSISCMGRSCYYNGSFTTVNRRRDSNWLANSWNGCIEERRTISTIRGNSGLVIPGGAQDLDVNLKPNAGDGGTRWTPQDGAARGVTAACPAETRKLATLDNRAALETIVNDIDAQGGTYHDIGLTWGARLISPDGLWGSDNPSTYNGYPVSRHMIFMTDGALAPGQTIYSAWGMEIVDKRVTGQPMNAQADVLVESHKQRARMMCNKIKDMNVKLWVVAFSTDITQELKDCSSGTGYWVQANNLTELRAAFRNIGDNIGSLRLSQ